MRKDLRMASIFAILDTGITIYIVATIVIKLFGEDYLAYCNFLNTLTWRWNILNVFRMALTAIIIHYLFNTFRKLDKINWNHIR